MNSDSKNLISFCKDYKQTNFIYLCIRYDNRTNKRIAVPAARDKEVSLTSKTNDTRSPKRNNLSLSPGFWDDSKRATDILKNIKQNEYWVKLYEQVETAVEDFAVLFDFWKAGDATEEETKVAFEKALQMMDDAEFKCYTQST